METSVVLSRKMGNFEITQRSTDGYFDSNALLNQWNIQPEKPRRRLDDFLESQNTTEFMAELSEELQSADNHLWRKSSNAENQLVVKQKGRMTMHGRTLDKTWMHPYLFIKFAMWINPRFEVTVIKFVYDELIKQRNEAGDSYREMSAAIAKITPRKDLVLAISKVAQGLNHICFGEHEKEIRNKQGEAPMKELVKLEQEITLLINVGHLKSFDQLHKYLQTKWRQKYQPSILS